MIEHRWIQAVIIAFWLVAMSWLTVTKIAPALATHDQPDQRRFRPESEVGISSQAWKVLWNQRRIGWARILSRHYPEGHGTVESVVRLENLTAQRMLKEMLGPAAMMLQPFRMRQGGDNMTLAMRITSTMNFDARGHLTHFNSEVHIDSLGQVLRTRGHVDDQKLSVDLLPGQVFLDSGTSDWKGMLAGAGITSPDNADPTENARAGQDVLLSRELAIPEDGFVADSMSPASQLTGLRLGQSWTFQAYRAYPPQNPLRKMEANVEREELLPWQDEIEPVWVVSYRDISGSGLTTASEPTSWLWVRRDGQVLKQQMRLGNVTIEFLRCDPTELPPTGSEPEDASSRNTRTRLGQPPLAALAHNGRGTAHSDSRIENDTLVQETGN